MLALYLLGGMLTYLGIGYKCAQVGLDYSAFHDTRKKKAISNAKFALFAWPIWMITKGTDMVFWKQITAKKKHLLLEQKQMKEVQKILDSGEI